MTTTPKWIDDMISSEREMLEMIESGVTFQRCEGEGEPFKDVTKEFEDRARSSIDQLEKIKSSYGTE